MISPVGETRMAPTGTSPAEAARWACLRARCIKCSSRAGSVGVVIASFEREAGAGSKGVKDISRA